MNYKNKKVLSEMVNRGIIPLTGSFDITGNLVDSFFSIYPEVNPGKGKKLRNSEVVLAKKIAYTVLLELLDSRIEPIEKKIIKAVDIKSGIVYIISNPAFPDIYKIGITRNIKERLNQYQTYDPYRLYKIEHSKFVENRRETEKLFLNKFKTNIVKGEWIKSDKLKKMFLDL